MTLSDFSLILCCSILIVMACISGGDAASKVKTHSLDLPPLGREI